MNIIVSFVHPPIPYRGSDWCAYPDHKVEDASYYGWGETREEALAELGGKILDRVQDHLYDMDKAKLITPDVYEECQHDICGLTYIPY